jgi:hypothetical protein
VVTDEEAERIAHPTNFELKNPNLKKPYPQKPRSARRRKL